MLATSTTTHYCALLYLLLLFAYVVVGAGDDDGAFSFAQRRSTSWRGNTFDAVGVTTVLEGEYGVGTSCTTSGENHVIETCSSPGEGTEDSPSCIDQERVTVVKNATRIWFTLRLANFATCDGRFVISVIPHSGISSVVVTAGTFTQTIFDVTTLISTSTIGPGYLTATDVPIVEGINPVSLCCANITSNSGTSWDGVFSILITSSANSINAEILVPASTAVLPIKEYAALIPTRVVCDGVPQTAVRGSPINILSASSDPIFEFWQHSILNFLGSNSLSLVESNTSLSGISTIIWISQMENNTKVANGDFGVGSLFADSIESGDNSCQVVYSNIVNEEGEYISVRSYPVIQQSICQYDKWKANRDQYSSLIAYLEQQEDLPTSAQTLGFRDLAEVLLSSVAYESCTTLIASFFNPTTPVSSYISKECWQIPGSPAWLADPCCSTYQAKLSCCSGIEVNITEIEYNINPNLETTLEALCVLPTCLEQPVKNLIQIASGSDSETCSIPRIQATSDARFSGTYFAYCKGRVYSTYCGTDGACADISVNSRCRTESLSCTIPCNTTDDCINGECTDLGSVFGKSCTNLDEDDDMQHRLLYECVMENIDPYLAVLVNAELAKDLSALPEYQKFANAITAEECLSPGGEAWVRPLTTKTACLAPTEGYCPWMVCIIGSNNPRGQLCTEELCLASMPYDFCSYDSQIDYLVHPVSRPDLCELRVTDTGIKNVTLWPQACTQFPGGKYAGPDLTTAKLFGPCLTDIQTRADCDLNPTCIPNYKNDSCVSYCYNSNVGTAAACLPTSPSGYSQQWYPLGTGGRCVIEAPTLDSCRAESGGTYQIGYRWLPAMINSQEECESYPGCWHSSLQFQRGLTEETCPQYNCSSCYTGTEQSCNSQSECESTESCNNPEGCRFWEWINELAPIPIACIWTPLGCILPTSRTSCAGYTTANGYLEATAFPTKEECLATPVCNDGTGPLVVPDSPLLRPSGLNLRNETECSKCGGTIQPFFQWKKSKWIQQRYNVPLTWKKSQILRPIWNETLSENAYNGLIDRARAARLAVILAAELYCLSIISAPIDTLAYACDGINPDQKDLSKIIDPTQRNTVGFIYACVNIPATTNIFTTTFYSSDAFAVTDNNTDPCIKASVDILPLELYEMPRRDIPSSLMLISESYKATRVPKFIFNSNQVVIGQIVTDGLSVRFYTERPVTGLRACIALPSIESVSDLWDIRAEYYEWDIVEADSDFVLTPLGLHAPLSQNEICFNITGRNIEFFVGLTIEDWETATISGSWKAEERGLIIFCVVMYFILFFFAFSQLLLQASGSRFRKFPGPELALSCVCVLAALGASQLLSIYQGTVAGNGLSPLLSDLQSLMLISCVVIILVTWSGIVASGKNLQKASNKYAVPLGFLFTLYILFVALLVASSATEEKADYTCATTEEERDATTTSESLALAYKAILACWAFILALVFSWMSIEVYALLKNYQKLANVVTKNIVASVSVILALLVLVAITLYSTQNELENTTKLAFHITILLLPAYCITYLYCVGSSFSSWKKWSSSRGTSRSTTGKSSSVRT